MTGTPFIPRTIVVHLGTPSSNAENIYVDFPDYIKNVASSEIYPTWPEAALRANIYAQISYALNRYYTEWYRSQGYDFDITNATQFDQAFVPGREIYDSISNIVDDIFNSYVVRRGSIEPYFTQYCNGTTSTCDGLSQWGTVPLAQQGLGPYEILTRFYGEDIDIVTDAPVRNGQPSYPGRPLRLGDSGNAVQQMQIRLNRISANYPNIPKINPTDGNFGVLKGSICHEDTVGGSVGDGGSTCFASDVDGIVCKDVGGGSFRGRKIHSLRYGIDVFLAHVQLVYRAGIIDQNVTSCGGIGYTLDQMGLVPRAAINDGCKIGGKLYGSEEVVRLPDGGLQCVAGVPLSPTGIGTSQRTCGFGELQSGLRAQS